MEKLTPELKKELLNELNVISLTYDDFNHSFEGDRRTNSTCNKFIESENLTIDIQFSEDVIWSATDDYEFEDLTISFLEIYSENGLLNTEDLDDEELLNVINHY